MSAVVTVLVVNLFVVYRGTVLSYIVVLGNDGYMYMDVILSNIYTYRNFIFFYNFTGENRYSDNTRS
jgi:hypothetical protein